MLAAEEPIHAPKTLPGGVKKNVTASFSLTYKDVQAGQVKQGEQQGAIFAMLLNAIHTHVHSMAYRKDC